MFRMSFRSRILLVVLLASIVPTVFVGFLLTGTAARSGEELLGIRLNIALDEAATEIAARWIRRRSQLLDLADHTEIRTALRGPVLTEASSIASLPGGDPSELGAVLTSAVARDMEGVHRWVLDDAERGGRTTRPGIGVELDVYESPLGEQIGTLEASLDANALVYDPSEAPAAFGLVLGVFDPDSGASFLSLPFDPERLRENRFELGEDEWLTARRTLRNPPVELVAAAPLTPFARPFEDAAQRGAWLLGAVAIAGLALVFFLTGRLTRSLSSLAEVADAVSRGDLEPDVVVSGEDEVGRVGKAFSSMTASLRRTLRELARREALSAVGEFSSTLAHEIRNPLTAVKAYLQRVEEELPEKSPSREWQTMALQEISRLDAALEKTLQVARTTDTKAKPVEIGEVLRRSGQAVRPLFEEHTLVLPEATLDPIWVRGDADALQQLFVNLLLNAGQALGEGGRVDVDVGTEGRKVVVAIQDTGSGIPTEDLDQIFEPFFSTRSTGTGLGLVVVQRIVRAHGGDIHVESTQGRGTTVRVHLPQASPA